MTFSAEQAATGQSCEDGGVLLKQFAHLTLLMLYSVVSVSSGVQGGHGLAGADAHQDGKGRSRLEGDPHARRNIQGHRGAHHLCTRRRRRVARTGVKMCVCG